MTGIAFGESPRWHDGRLWFADWEAEELIAVDLDGDSEVVMPVASFPFCIDWLPDPDGRLLIVSARDRALLRREPDGALVTHADLSALSEHPWNDIVVDARGNAYVGNIGFDIAADGGLSNRRVWAHLDGGAPDGICLDAEGAVWYGDVPNQRCVRVREGGEVLQTIALDRGCFACMLGGADGKTLFMVAQEWGGMESTTDRARTGQVLTVPAPAPGAGWP